MLEYDGLLALDRFERAVARVRERLLRATSALELAGVPYAVAGGNAVMAWVEQVDESAMRVTPDVDIVMRRGDFERARAALIGVGFRHYKSSVMEIFLDGPNAKLRDAVHLLFANEISRQGDLLEVPDVFDSVSFNSFRVLDLEALVRMKLVSYRNKDCMHLHDMLDVGLIDASWPAKFPPELADRLQHLIDTPDG